MKRYAALVLCLALATGCSDTLTQVEEQARLGVESVKLKTWVADPTLTAAIKAQNAQNLTLTEIKARDASWIAGTAPALVTAVTTGACADRLRALAAQSNIFGEVILMDNQGANVCASAKTTDYWQGDEDKFTKSFGAGANAVFIDAVAFDASAGERLSQISLPVSDNGVLIGALTVGIRVDKF
jgi:hypothetical protein